MAHTRCEQCKFWRQIDRKEFGHCHRYPPVFIGKPDKTEPDDWEQPQTKRDHWCGEYQVEIK